MVWRPLRHPMQATAPPLSVHMALTPAAGGDEVKTAWEVSKHAATCDVLAELCALFRSQIAADPIGCGRGNGRPLGSPRATPLKRQHVNHGSVLVLEVLPAGVACFGWGTLLPRSTITKATTREAAAGGSHSWTYPQQTHNRNSNSSSRKRREARAPPPPVLLYVARRDVTAGTLSFCGSFTVPGTATAAALVRGTLELAGVDPRSPATVSKLCPYENCYRRVSPLLQCTVRARPLSLSDGTALIVSVGAGDAETGGGDGFDIALTDPPAPGEGRGHDGRLAGGGSS